MTETSTTHQTRLGGFFVAMDAPEVGVPNSPRAWLAHWKQATLKCLAADTRLTRGALAGSSILMAIELFMPWSTLSRHGNEILSQVFRDSTLGTVFTLHAVLMLRTKGLLGVLERPTLDKWGYRLGFLLFFALGLSVDLSVGAFTLQSGAVLFLAAQAFWLMIRRGNGAEGVL